MRDDLRRTVKMSLIQILLHDDEVQIKKSCMVLPRNPSMLLQDRKRPLKLEPLTRQCRNNKDVDVLSRMQNSAL